MSGSAPLDALFDVSIVGLLLESCPFLFHVFLCVLLVESLMLFPFVAVFPVLFVSVYTSPLVSAAPPVSASRVDPLPSVVVTDHPIDESERIIPGLFLPFEVNIIEFNYRFSYLFI